MNGKYEDIGSAFGGDISGVKSEDLHQFFVENREKTPFTKTGEGAYLKAMGIPVAFFNNQTIPTQDAILVRQQQVMREKSKSMLLLQKEKKITFASPLTEMGWEDPSEVMGLSSELGFAVTDKYRYTFRVDGAGYQPTVFVTVPVLYSKNILISIGLFKAAGIHGYALIDRENTSTINIRPKDFNKKNFISLLTGIREILLDMKPMYESFTDYLRNRTVLLNDVMGLYEDVFDKWKFPKTLVDKVKSHVDLLKEGKDIDPTSPPVITNWYEAADVITYYASKLPSATSQEKAEAGAFHYFYDAAKTAGAIKISGSSKKIRMLATEKFPHRPEVSDAAKVLGAETSTDKPTEPVVDLL